MTPNERYKKLFTESKTIPTELCEEIAYIDLYAKAKLEMLTPGKYYRITDYETVTNPRFSNRLSSAGHQFDVIVLAISESKFSDNAFATQHSGDNYFSNSSLSAWELKYDFFGNIYNGDWYPILPAEWSAGPTDIEFTFTLENSNEITPTYIGIVTDAITGEKSFKFEDSQDSLIHYYVPVTDDLTSVHTAYSVTDGEEIKSEIAVQSISYAPTENTYSKGIIYNMKDEAGIEVYYDFKNVLISGNLLSKLLDRAPFRTYYSGTPCDVDKFYYTFSYVNNGTISDASVEGFRLRNIRIRLGENSAYSGKPTVAFILGNNVGHIENITIEDCTDTIFSSSEMDNCKFVDSSYILIDAGEFYNCSVIDSDDILIRTNVYRSTFNTQDGSVVVKVHTGTVPDMDISIHNWNFEASVVLDGFAIPTPGGNYDSDGWTVKTAYINNATRICIFKEALESDGFKGAYWDSTNQTWVTLPIIN